MTATLIYHACTATEWREAEREGQYRGSSNDAADGFIHFSTADQLGDSLAKHRAGEDDLVLVTAATAALGEALRWEPARDGQLFPHLYGPLPAAAIIRVEPLLLGPDGRHVLPASVPPKRP